MIFSSSLLRIFNIPAAILLLASLAGVVQANLFLGKVPVHLESNLELEHQLLSDIEGVLGNEHRLFTEKRLNAITQLVRPIFTAMPKNEHGKLGSAATSYALYRIFVSRHAWFVTGLEPFKAMAEWSSSSPTQILDQRVPEFITGLFSTRMGETGFGVHELSVLAATIEHLVHKESLLRATVAYRALNSSIEDILSEEETQNVMDTYMSLYVLGPMVSNLSTVSTKWVQTLRQNVTSLYPGFEETQQFLRDVQQSVAPKRDYFYFADVASLVEEVGDRYGRWQDQECRTLKDHLVEMEDPSSGGAGRVRLADFYGAALNQGKWQFSEKVEYLRQLGALDESIPDNVRVIIPNYVNGPSNCVASSSYYSVCCVNECDELLGHLETKIAGPEATPAAIVQIVQDLPSSTVPSNRTLPAWLTHRLEEAAGHHGGTIPLHGRLFSQWMHFAFPRECPYPHVVGTTRPQTTDAFVKETRGDFVANTTEMKKYVAIPAPHQRRTTETGTMEEVLSLESAMWTMDEELVVSRATTIVVREALGVDFASFAPAVRGVMFMIAVAAFGITVVRTVDSKLSGGLQGKEKFFV